jgi:hypothetical protein
MCENGERAKVKFYLCFNQKQKNLRKSGGFCFGKSIMLVLVLNKNFYKYREENNQQS